MNNENNNMNNGQYDPKNPNNNYDPFKEEKRDVEFEKKWRSWNNMKPAETPENNFYGVDVNNKKAVKKEYIKLKIRHIFVTILSLIILGVLGVVIFEAYRVNIKEQKPMFAIKKRVDGGYLYQGLGFKSLFCDDGTKYVMYSEYTSCTDQGVTTYIDILTKSFLSYGKENKIYNEGNVSKFEIKDYVFDDTITDTYTDLKTGDEVTVEYSVFLTTMAYTCTDGSTRCIDFGIDFEDYSNAKVYLIVDKDQHVTDVKTFMDSGKYYDELQKQFREDLKTYLIDNNYVPDINNLRSVDLDVTNMYGSYKYDGVMYANAYKFNVHYLCTDNSNTCITYEDYIINDNLSFDIAVFVDKDNKIQKIAKSVTFDL